MHIRLLLTLCLALAAVIAPSLAHAQPANDSWANRTAITTLPFSVSEPQAGQATNDPSDPDPPCRGIGSNPLSFSLWYSFTTGAQVEYLNASITGGDIAGVIAMYTGSPGQFRLVSGACGRRGNSSSFPPRFVGVRLEPNTSYSILAGSQFPVPPPQAFVVNVAAAPRLQVTKTADTRDGACDSDCSLREAIDAANASASVVLVPPGNYAITREGRDEDGNATGDFDLLASMGMYGADFRQSRIDANGFDRVLDLAPNGGTSPNYASFALGNLPLRGGLVVGGDFQKDGGNLRQRGSTQFFGLERVDAVDGNAQQYGGGFYLEGSGTVRFAMVLLNESGFAGGGIAVVTNPNAVEIEHSHFALNDSLQGGGLHVQGDAFVSNSTFDQNHADLEGGAINAAIGRLSLASSTVVDNESGLNGGGGGLYVAAPTLGPNHPVTNTILARNRAAGDDSADCTGPGPALRSYDVVQSGSDCGPPGTGDVVGVDPGLTAFSASNGGSLDTFALLTGSPALDAGDPTGCRDARNAVVAVDQRGPGFPRIVNGRCDIGALESPVVLPPGAPQLDAASDTGLSNSDRITNDLTPRFTGTCVDGTGILLRWTGFSAPFVSCVAGVYDVTANMVTPGFQRFTAEASGPAGNSLRSDSILVIIDAQAPAAPTITGPATAQALLVTLTGTASEAGQVTVRESAAVRCTALAGDDGAWQCDAVFATTGSHTVAATETDVAGNIGPASTGFTITIAESILSDGFE